MKSFDNATRLQNHPTLLSYDWKEKNPEKESEFAYYRDLYIENQKTISEEFIRRPQRSSLLSTFPCSSDLILKVYTKVTYAVSFVPLA